MESIYQMELVFEIPNCTLYDIQDGNVRIMDKGPLAIYELKSYNLMVLKLGLWQYSLSKDIPVMSQIQNTRKMYAFHKYKGNYGILLDQYVSAEQESVFEYILETYTDFVVSTPTNSYDTPQTLIQEEIKQSQKSTSQKIQGYLQKGGAFIRSGLITGAGFIAKGIQNGGQYIKSKITKPTHKEIKPETIQKVKMARATSSAVLVYTQSQISALIQGAKMIGEEIGNQVGQSETGQKIKSHKNYEDAKNITKGTVNAVAAIYDGMFEALNAIGKGFQGTATDVIHTKYGNAAGQFAHESFETAANIGDMAKVHKVHVAKAFHQGTDHKVRH